MKNIMLACSAGMSTSLLVTKMKAAAKEKKLEVGIFAVPEAEIKSRADEADILLMGPQIRYAEKTYKNLMAEKGKKAFLINPMDYGTLNGAKILDFALKELQ